MARPLRPDQPGFGFHLTTRLQDRAHRFTGPVRDRVAGFLARQVERSDARLLAYAVMTNHLHLVVIQGAQPVWKFMQPLLCSVAMSVQRVHHLEGHVFERRYRDTVCQDVDHLRNAIAYVHANPVRAGLCDDPRLYRWSSHAAYAAVAAGRRPRSAVPLDLESGLAAFGALTPGTAREAATLYLAHFERFVCAPLGPEELDGADPTVPASLVRGGEAVGDPADSEALIDPRLRLGHESMPPKEPLEVIAQRVLGPMRGKLLSPRWRSPGRRDLRRAFALSASRAGYTGREIAAFLEVSPATVSRLLSPPDHVVN